MEQSVFWSCFFYFYYKRWNQENKIYVLQDQTSKIKIYSSGRSRLKEARPSKPNRFKVPIQNWKLPISVLCKELCWKKWQGNLQNAEKCYTKGGWSLLQKVHMNFKCFSSFVMHRTWSICCQAIGNAQILVGKWTWGNHSKTKKSILTKKYIKSKQYTKRTDTVAI